MKNRYYFLLFLVLLVAACSKGDDSTENTDDAFNGSVNSATVNDIAGVWSIFSAEFEGEKFAVPPTSEQCGRDFFVFSTNGTYTEYVYRSSSCEPEINRLTFTLDRGVITLTNAIGQSDELVLTKLNNQELVFKSRLDVDEDGDLDELLFTANRYEADEFDLTTSTFNQNQDEAFENLLSFTWEAYDGFNTFDRYEIYRSSGPNCTKANASLIATITDVGVMEYTDLNPPGAESLCYYLRVYTDEGLLGESNFIGVNPSFFIYIDAVSLNRPTVDNTSISLSWEPSESPYFSHYEVTVSNFGGTSASAAQEYVLAEIDDINATNYKDENPPYLENPFYAVYAYNIFGNKSPLIDNNGIAVFEVPFKRKEVIELRKIISLDVDTEEPVVYLYGENTGNGITGVTMLRFNYETQETEAVADIPPQAETYSGIKVFTSPENGKELVLQQGIELHFYDARTMEFKYAIDPEGVFSFNNFSYHEALDVWVMVNDTELFILERDNTNLSVISSATHYPTRQGPRLELFNLDNQRILVGHFFESNSIVFTLDVMGTITDTQTVDFGVGIDDDDKTLQSEAGNYFLDTEVNRLYSTTTFDVIESFEFPSFPSGISTNGNQIFGTNNDPDWQINAESPHKKEAVLYSRTSGQVDEYSTLGYPHFIFENYRREVMSISSGFKKETLDQNINGKADLFIERVEVP
ncbi:MAG: lipocalin family protein [Bacteroidota bacterium]